MNNTEKNQKNTRKTCPFLSRFFIAKGPYDQDVTEFYEEPCMHELCQLWDDKAQDCGLKK